MNALAEDMLVEIMLFLNIETLNTCRHVSRNFDRNVRVVHRLINPKKTPVFVVVTTTVAATDNKSDPVTKYVGEYYSKCAVAVFTEDARRMKHILFDKSYVFQRPAQPQEYSYMPFEEINVCMIDVTRPIIYYPDIGMIFYITDNGSFVTCVDQVSSRLEYSDYYYREYSTDVVYRNRKINVRCTSIVREIGCKCFIANNNYILTRDENGSHADKFEYIYRAN